MDDKRHRSSRYGIKKTPIKSISWQWLYATHLLVGHELILTSKDAPLCCAPYSWLPVEVVVIFGWLFKNYWNPESPLFNPIEQQGATTILTRRDYPFATITLMYGSGGNPPQDPPSEPSGQQVREATIYPRGFFIRLMYSDLGDGKGGPQEFSHTLGLNCFAYPCHGVCQFQPSGATPGQSACPHSVNEHCLGCTNHFGPGNARQPVSAEAVSISDPDEILNDNVQIPGNVPLNVDDEIIVDGLLSLRKSPGCLPSGGATHCQQTPSNRKQQVRTGRQVCDIAVVGEDLQQRPCGKVCMNVTTLSYLKSGYHSGHRICDLIVVGKDGQPQPCGMIFKGAKSLSDHRGREHSGQQTCDVTVVGEDGRQRPCGKVSRNAKALSSHKSGYHSGQRICDVIVIGEDGQPQPCGKARKSLQDLLDHKRRDHSEQQTCEETRVGDDGLQRPCGKVFKNSKSLSEHKSKYHRGPQICGVTVVGEAGEPRPCGTVCKNAKVLSDHKIKVHSGQQTCKVSADGEDSQQRPCGKVFNNAKALSDHRRKYHTGEKTCQAKVVGEDGQPQSCGKVCKSAQALADHKRIHRKRKLVDMNQDDHPTHKSTMSD
ncbi:MULTISPECIES: hypothetical protein [unclassified Endozoicomonas]|uniref:hypothetical protein n=1 Tax=unclassified Endozoicomonas TaxID=2644528 RepID=UPI002147ABA9|nr:MULTISPECIES: hypothetical protein [unclassified Endozoicomonas]